MPVMERLINLGTLLDNTLGVVNAYENRYGKLENHGKPVDPYVPPECKVGEVKREICWDGSEIITHVCGNDEKWVATGNVCPVKPPVCTLWGHFKRLNFKAAWEHILGKHGG
jgi:hypothetical protein